MLVVSGNQVHVSFKNAVGAKAEIGSRSKVVGAEAEWAGISGGGKTTDVGRHAGDEDGQPIVAAVNVGSPLLAGIQRRTEQRQLCHGDGCEWSIGPGSCAAVAEKSIEPEVHVNRGKLLNTVGVLVGTKMSDFVMDLEGERMISDRRDCGFDVNVADHRLPWTSTLVVRVPLDGLSFDVE